MLKLLFQTLTIAQHSYCSLFGVQTVWQCSETLFAPPLKGPLGYGARWTEYAGMMGIDSFASKGERMQADTFNDLLWSDPADVQGFVAGVERCRGPTRTRW